MELVRVFTSSARRVTLDAVVAGVIVPGVPIRADTKALSAIQIIVLEEVFVVGPVFSPAAGAVGPITLKALIAGVDALELGDENGVGQVVDDVDSCTIGVGPDPEPWNLLLVIERIGHEFELDCDCSVEGYES